MESKKIRQLFLDFFSQKGHEIVRSSNLLPKDDPTLLFTNAGMVQFKSVFLGEEKRPYNRAVTVQKCLRAGGKHNDLENVGRTARHHTFFEMLGNFSFGDYFKKEATTFAWEFLTEWVKLPKDRLYVTVYEKDDEAEELWKNHVGVPAERIFRLGEKDNFWQMGDTGPCGPCSEILIDQGADLSCGSPGCRVGCDCDRYLEIWNLVFMQFNRDQSGTLTPLPKPSIDTGMGLERLSAVLQGKRTNFDTDLFMPIIRAVEVISGKKYGSSQAADISMRVIADHIRTAGFVLSEGLFPSNEGRGYVLRRIVRRAARHGYMLGIQEPFLHTVLDSLYGFMGEMYPELLENTDRSKMVLKFEEERFAHTLSSGMEILNRLMDEQRGKGSDTIPGSELFRLYDTYGFPADLAQDIAADNKFSIDLNGFNAEMEAQKTRARASWVGEEEITGIYREIRKEHGATEFLGYDALHAACAVTAIIKNGTPADEVLEGEEAEVVLDRSPFYGESGGQTGDSGAFSADGVRAEVMDTKKFSDILIHIIAVKKGVLRKGATVTAAVNEGKRRSIMRNHTATHLLHTALRTVLGDHIKQAGSLVSPDRLRFDFTHFSAMKDREIEAAEALVNERIIANMPVQTTVTNLDDAVSRGVIALFGEKYGEKVRVVQAGDFSAELCGGTHCGATGEIGPFKILSEGSVAAGIRRIEALTGLPSIEFFKTREKELKTAASLLKVGEMKVSEKVEKVLAELKHQEKELDKVRKKSAVKNVDALLNEAMEINGIKVISRRIDGVDMKALRDLTDSLRNRIGSGIIMLASVLDGQAYYVSAVTKDLAGRFHAGELLKAATGGKGGGRPDMAQGGTKEVEGIDKALNTVPELIQRTA